MRIREIRGRESGQREQSSAAGDSLQAPSASVRLSSPKSLRRFTGQALDSVAGGLRFDNHETADREHLAVSGFIVHGVLGESAELSAFANSSCPNAPPPSGYPQSSQSHRH